MTIYTVYFTPSTLATILTLGAIAFGTKAVAKDSIDEKVVSYSTVISLH